MTNTMPTHVYGRSGALQERFGIDQNTGPLLAAILIFGGNTENHLERAIWRLEDWTPDGSRPPTDARTISDLIKMLADVARGLEANETRRMLESWCETATMAFQLRNNIAHGMSVRMGDATAYFQNPRWGGVQRKRPSKDFWPDEHVLTMLRDCFATLLRIIAAVAKGTDVASDALAMRALHEAKAILSEFSDPMAYNPTFEKY